LKGAEDEDDDGDAVGDGDLRPVNVSQIDDMVGKDISVRTVCVSTWIDWLNQNFLDPPGHVIGSLYGKVALSIFRSDPTTQEC
jgi:hypothetical protein